MKLEVLWFQDTLVPSLEQKSSLCFLIYFSSLEPMNTSCQIKILRNPISARLIAHSFFRVWLNLGCSTKYFSMNMFPQSRMTRCGKQRSDELHFAEVCQEGSSSVRLCTTGLPLPKKRCRWWWSLMTFDDFWTFDLEWSLIFDDLWTFDLWWPLIFDLWWSMNFWYFDLWSW